MTPTPHLQRALVLHEQGRHELAEKELQQHLTLEPDDALAYAVLSLSRLELERLPEADSAARTAIGKNPNLALAHYALARVLTERNREDEALAAVEEAIRLEPTDAHNHGLRSMIEFRRRRWKEALEAAEQGLQFDPENNMCNNLRAMALVKLGRRDEAGATIERTLARNPDDSVSHANLGWALLEGGEPKQAMHHFRESLRLDPTNDWARAGMVEALKASNPIYAVMLKYFLFMQRLSSRAQWAIILGGFFLIRSLGGTARANPGLAPYVLPIQILYITFALLTWLAVPVFNLLLFLHPLGRHALDDDQKKQAICVGTCIGLGFASLGAFLLGESRFLLPAIIFGLLALPISAVFTCDRGWPRSTMLGIASVLGLLALSSVVIIALIRPPDGSQLDGVAHGLSSLYFLGIFVTQFLANILAAQRPRK